MRRSTRPAAAAPRPYLPRPLAPLSARAPRPPFHALALPIVPLAVLAGLQQVAPASAEAPTGAGPEDAAAVARPDVRDEVRGSYSFRELVSSRMAPRAAASPSTTPTTPAPAALPAALPHSWLCLHCEHPIAEAAAAVLVGDCRAVHASCAVVILNHPDVVPTLHRRLVHGLDAG